MASIQGSCLESKQSANRTGDGASTSDDHVKEDGHLIMTSSMTAELERRLLRTTKEFVHEMGLDEKVEIGLHRLFSDWKKEMDQELDRHKKYPAKKAKRVGSSVVVSKAEETGTFELRNLGLATSVTKITAPTEGSSSGNPANPGQVYEFVAVLDRQRDRNGQFLYRVDWGEGFEQTWEPIHSLLEVDARELVEIQITADYRDSIVQSNATIFPGKDDNIAGRIPDWKIAQLPEHFAEDYSRKLHHWVQKQMKTRPFLQLR